MAVDFALQVQAIQRVQPMIRIHHQREWREVGQGGKGGAWGLIATGERLVGTLDMVVLDEGLGDLPRLLQGGRTIQGETLLLIGAIRAFHKGVLLGVLRITDVHLDAQTGTEAHQRRGKITARRTAHPARIAIQGEQLRPALCLARLGDGR